MKVKESGLVAVIMQYLHFTNKSFFWRCNTGAMRKAYTDKKGVTRTHMVRFGFPGIADIIGVYKGQFIAIECKIGNNTQSSPQKSFQAAVEQAGGKYILAYTLDDVINEIGDKE